MSICNITGEMFHGAPNSFDFKLNNDLTPSVVHHGAQVECCCG